MNAHASGLYALENPPAASCKQEPVTTVSRQPIYDQEQRLYAYTLTHHTPMPQTQEAEEPSHHTAALICCALMENSLDTLIGPYQAVFRLTRGLLIMDYALVLPADRVIVEVAEFTVPDTALVEACRELAEQGYRLALTTNRNMVALRPLLEAANLLRIDLKQWSLHELRDHVAQCRQYKARLLADNVNTPADMAYCAEFGFDYFQGAAFGQGDTIQLYRSPTYRPRLLHLMTHLINPMTDIDTVETLIRHDLSLSYKLLRLVNTEIGGSRQPITSLRQALHRLGIRALITWVSFILLSGFDDTPHEMASTAVVRARMCELLAQAMDLGSTDTFFLTGLLSGLDTLLHRPMPELLDALPLHDDIRQSILCDKGDFARILRAVLAYEGGQWDKLQTLGIDSSTMTDSYLRAIVWAETHKGAK